MMITTTHAAVDRDYESITMGSGGDKLLVAASGTAIKFQLVRSSAPATR